jgi:hypothetical protein
MKEARLGAGAADAYEDKMSARHWSYAAETSGTAKAWVILAH